MKTVAIVGGGFTGGAVAYHLAGGTTPGDVRIVVFEPRPRLGAGLAYSADDPAHRVNVPASKMSLLPEDEGHFARWLETSGRLAADPEAWSATGSAFPARSVFGDYMAENLRPLVAAGIVEHHREAVTDIGRADKGWLLGTASGARIVADLLVLATTHPPPAVPDPLRSIEDAPGFIADATRPGALTGIAREARVLVVGTGLTAADVVATLDRRGHRGPITLLSRRGLRSRGHAPAGSAVRPFGDFATHPRHTALELLRTVRAEISAANAAGLSWHAVFDALRSQGGDIWRGLPLVERQKLVRHLRIFWDVHRFRVAPQIDDVILRGLEAGRIAIVSGRLTSSTLDENGHLAVSFRRRASEIEEGRSFDWVVIATGPSHGQVLQSQPHLSSLAADGILTIDSTRLGIACDEGARVVRADGKVEPEIYVAGPLARGTFGELMGLPQVTEQSVLVANAIATLCLSCSPSKGRPAGSSPGV